MLATEALTGRGGPGLHFYTHTNIHAGPQTHTGAQTYSLREHTRTKTPGTDRGKDRHRDRDTQRHSDIDTC